MKDRKFRDRMITILEMALLAGMVLLSFYLLFCSVRQGEQAVNGTAEGLVTGTPEKAAATEDAETEESEPEGFEPEGAELGGAETDKAEMEGAEPDKAKLEDPELEASEKEVVEAGENESERGSDENGEGVDSDTELVYRLEEESPFIRVRILNSDYTEDCFDEIQITGTAGFTAEWGTYGEDYGFCSTMGPETSGERNLFSLGDDEETTLGKSALEEDELGKAISSGQSMEAETMTAEGREKTASFAAGEVCTIVLDDLAVGEAVCFTSSEGGSLTAANLERSYGAPEYAGLLVVYRLTDGLALVNVLELEEYLYAVVPSEMPSYYPAEALKAQAVCARTYAWLCMEKNDKQIADLDDSVAFQVYNNRKSTDASREAVDATCGEVLSVEEVLYYSTSCLSMGQGDLSDEAGFRDFLDSEAGEGAEYGSAWVRWQVEIPISQILQTLADEYAICADTLDTVTIESRSENGQALLLRVEAQGEVLEVEGEYAIRAFLAPQEADVVLMDGSVVSGMQLLPSAFFYLAYSEPETVDGESERLSEEMAVGETAAEEDMVIALPVLRIFGGGYGHGNGMSQCGAAQMAADGASYLEILEYYYGDAG